MHSIEDICRTAMALAGRGDKPSSDDLAEALRHMNLILNDWVNTRGVILWSILEQSIDIPLGTIVLHNGEYFQCFVGHESAAGNEPGADNDEWRNYWTPTTPTTNPLTWAAGNVYPPNDSITLTGNTPTDILAVRLQHEGQMSPVEKIKTMPYTELARNEVGTPVKVYAQKTEAGLTLKFWPMNNLENAKLFFFTAAPPPEYTASDITAMESQWVTALQYALATELGFLYNIELNRLDLIGKKAEFEFMKAFRTNESEVDECSIKPLY